MKKTKLTLDFKDIDEYARKLDKFGGDLNRTVEKALTESKDLINEQLHSEMKRHRRTGRTERSIRDDAKVTWSGTLASIDVGFDILNGGLPSIFLMYGTPKQPKDQKIFDAVYGRSTKRKIKEIQEKIFREALKEVSDGR